MNGEHPGPLAPQSLRGFYDQGPMRPLYSTSCNSGVTILRCVSWTGS